MLCTYCQWHLSRELDDPRDLPWLARRHLAGCPVCAAERDRLGALHGALAAGVVRAAPPVPARGRARWPALALAAMVTGAAAIAAVVAFRPHAPAPPPALQASRLPAPATADRSTGPAEADVAARLADLRHRAERDVRDALDRTPLEHELHALASDGQRGARAVLAVAGLDRGPGTQ